MKKILLFLALGLSLTAMAQDNTWEQPEEEEPPQVRQQADPNAKYLEGAVPEVNGRITFQKDITAPGKTATQIYAIVKGYMEKMARERNQIESNVGYCDSVACKVGGSFSEWLVFRSTALALDRTQFNYQLMAECEDGHAHITLTRINYLYEETSHYKAEEWISDKYALNKKKTKLLPISGKFRRKTVDRVHFLFDKFESLLNP